MTPWLTELSLILAQAEAQPAAQEGLGNSFWVQAIPMIVIGVLAYFMLMLPERKRQERMRELQNVKEKDHIITSGGIHGVITNVQREQGRATLRIDEANGTKIRIELSSIARILTNDEKGTGDAA